MAINFNENAVFNLKPMSLDSIRKEVAGLLITDETPIVAFKSVRDQLIFTNKRIIAIDVQGVTGKRKTFACMPYTNVQFFTVQTPGFAEIFSDAELYLMFSNGFTATFEFRGDVDIGLIGRVISEYALR